MDDPVVITTNLSLWGLYLMGLATGGVFLSFALVPMYNLGRRQGRAEQAMKNLEKIR